MQKFIGISVLAGLSGAAHAHGLPSDAGLLIALSHQTIGLHHLPGTALLIIATVMLLRSCHAVTRRTK